MTLRSFAVSLADAGRASPMKQAAIYLHGLEQGDRQWLLAQLEPAARAELTALLDELRAIAVLGRVGASRSSVASGTSAPAQRTESAKLPSPALAAAGVMRAPARDVVHLLESESDGLIVRFLRHADAAWTRSLLACFEPRRRHRLAAMLHVSVPPATKELPALPVAVFDILSRRLAEMATQRRRPSPAWVARLHSIGGRWSSRPPVQIRGSGIPG